jgi:hypothetical protein
MEIELIYILLFAFFLLLICQARKTGGVDDEDDDQNKNKINSSPGYVGQGLVEVITGFFGAIFDIIGAIFGGILGAIFE